jgi:hypothetical protein
MDENHQAQLSQFQLVEDIRSELAELDASALSEHSARYEQLHKKLEAALSAIDGI